MAKVATPVKDTLTEQAEASKQSMVDVNQQASQNLVKAENLRKNLLKEYQTDEKVPMYLSPMYKSHFGNVMQVMINGISIFFKVDGSTQMVPQSFADEITARRMAVDAILTKQSRMADVSSNAESSPGELALF